jgi:hypothetical protein
MIYNKPQDSVPLPESMSGLPRDRRGYPIPWIVLRDRTGRPHFTINDSRKVKECGKFGLCGICGKPLGKHNPKNPHKGAWFVGGPASFYMDRGAFLDPPMHRECATYALTVCPYIANPSYGKRIDDATLKAEHVPEGTAIIAHDGHTLNDKPPLFILGLARRWESFEPAPGQTLFKVRNYKHDWVVLSAWKDGEELDVESREVRDAIKSRIRAVEGGY